MKNLKVLSLFSGCGGMDLGLEGDFSVFKDSVNPKIHPDWISGNTSSKFVNLAPTNFTTVFANDIRPDAKTAWEHFFMKRRSVKDVYCLESIVTLVKRFKNGETTIFPNNVDIVTGGFPCQDFSIAGKRQGFNSKVAHTGRKTDNAFPTIESRGQLYMWMKEVIEITKPKLFIAENVKGLVNLEDVKEQIQKDFSKIAGNGYIVHAKVLHAANYGIPQSRERVFFIGFNRSALNTSAIKALQNEDLSPNITPFPEITHCLPNKKRTGNLKNAVTLRKILSDLPEPVNSRDLSQKKYSKAKYMGKHCQGQTEIDLDGIGPTIRSEHHGNIEYRRLSSANGGTIKEELDRGLVERRLSVRECARIQTFPDNYEFVFQNKTTSISASEAYKLIGNAVPPLLAYNVARKLQENWNKYFKENK